MPIIKQSEETASIDKGVEQSELSHIVVEA